MAPRDLRILPGSGCILFTILSEGALVKRYHYLVPGLVPGCVGCLQADEMAEPTQVGMVLGVFGVAIRG